MRNDRAEFELLLTTARLLRALLQDRHADYGASADVALLDEALKPFDPSKEHGGDFQKWPLPPDPHDAGARGLARMIKDYGIECPLVKQKLDELAP